MQESSRQYTHNLCPECKSNHKVYDYTEGIVVCGDCGFVLRESMIYRGPNWRGFTEGGINRKNHFSRPINYLPNNNGSSTTIGHVDRYGRKLPLDTRMEMNRLRKWQNRVDNDNYKKNLSRAMKELWRLRDVLHIPLYVIENAGLIYRKALDKNLIWGRNILGIADATLYLACRIHGIPRTLKEIANKSSLNEKSIGGYYRFLLNRLDDLQMPFPDPKDFFSRIGSGIGIYGNTQGMAARILDFFKKKNLHFHRSRKVVTATAYNLAYMIDRNNGGEIREEITQKELAKRAGVTYNAMRIFSNIIFETIEPSELANELGIDKEMVKPIFVEHENRSKIYWSRKK